MPRSVTKNMTSKLPNEIEIQDIGKSGKTYSVLNPKYLSNEHKLLLSKRCTTFDEYVKKYLKIMDVNEKTKTSVRMTLGKIDLKVIFQCLICKRVVLDDSNMKKHIKNHSREERKSHTIRKSLTQDVISSFVKQKTILRPEIWNIASKTDGFLEQVVYHLDKFFVPFASAENPA